MTEVSERVLVLAPRGRDAELTCSMLAAHGLAAVTCTDGSELIRQIGAGAGCAVVTSEVLDREVQQQIAAVLADQPPWSDFPFVVLTASAATKAAVELGNMTVLERPIGVAALVAAVRAALRGRRRQYEARAAIRQRDEFLAMLGHELRNPLAAITLAAEPLDLATQPMLVKRLAVVARQTTHLSRLLDDLLDVARVTSGKVQLRCEAVDVDAAIREGVDSLLARARAGDIAVVMQLASGAIIEGDVGRIVQVIGNLLTNAIKYSPRGTTVTVASQRVGDACEIRVRDQGIGIAPDMLGRVFELFTQADRSLDRSEGGMGIGLALVDRLVRLHGGTVAVTSAGLGAGTELVVRLPVGAPPGVAEREPVSAPADTQPLRVVIVEDNTDLAELTQVVVESLGCTSEIASDGEAGLERILASEPELALIDIGLPKLDGFELAALVRERLAHPPVLVAITGYGQRGDQARALAAGFDEHLTKPVSSDTLQRLVATTRARLVRARSTG